MRLALPLLFLFLCMGLLDQGAARAEGYLAIMGGGAFPNDFSNVKGRGGLAGIDFPDLSMGASGLVGGKAGYFFERVKWFGVESEVFYTKPSFDQQTVFGVPSGSLTFTGDIDLQLITWTFNVMFRYPGEKFQPYAGIGFGLFFAEFQTATLSDSDNGVPGGNLMAGLRYMFTPHLGGFVEYKFNRVSLAFNDVVALSPSGLGGIEGDYTANMFAVGLGYHF